MNDIDTVVIDDEKSNLGGLENPDGSIKLYLYSL